MVLATEKPVVDAWLLAKDSMESRLLGELKRVKRDCDEAYETANADPQTSTHQAPPCQLALLEQRLDQFQQTMEETLQAQWRDFEDKLQRISSSSALMASTCETSLVQHGERLGTVECLLEEQMQRGKVLTEGVMQLGVHVKQVEDGMMPKREIRCEINEIRYKLEDMSSRIECQELDHARLAASVLCEDQTRLAECPVNRITLLDARFEKLSADVAKLRADAKLGPQILAFMDAIKDVAPKLSAHEECLNELRVWQEEQSSSTKAIMTHTSAMNNAIMARTSAMEEQLEQSLSSTREDTNTLVREVSRLKSKLRKTYPHFVLAESAPGA